MPSTAHNVRCRFVGETRLGIKMALTTAVRERSGVTNQCHRTTSFEALRVFCGSALCAAQTNRLLLSAYQTAGLATHEQRGGTTELTVAANAVVLYVRDDPAPRTQSETNGETVENTSLPVFPTSHKFHFRAIHTPNTVSPMPIKAKPVRVSSNSAQAMSAVVGGVR